MVRLYLLSFIITLPFFSVAQNNKVIKFGNCEIIHSDTINCTINGVRSGYWIIYKPDMEPQHENRDPNLWEYSYLIAEGRYISGIKIGKWKHYTYNRYGRNDIQFVNKTINYNNSGIKDSIEVHYSAPDVIKSKLYRTEGSIDSLFVLFSSGNLHCKAYFQNNNIKEFWIYYPSGELKYHGEEISEFKIGKLEYFDLKGLPLLPRTVMLPDISLVEGLLEYL